LDYKTSEGVDPALLSQFPILEHALQSMGVLVWPMIEFEADDALASAAAKAAQDDCARRVIICTPDKDPNLNWDLNRSRSQIAAAWRQGSHRLGLNPGGVGIWADGHVYKYFEDGRRGRFSGEAKALVVSHAGWEPPPLKPVVSAS